MPPAAGLPPGPAPPGGPGGMIPPGPPQFRRRVGRGLECVRALFPQTQEKRRAVSLVRIGKPTRRFRFRRGPGGGSPLGRGVQRGGKPLWPPEAFPAPVHKLRKRPHGPDPGDAEQDGEHGGHRQQHAVPVVPRDIERRKFRYGARQQKLRPIGNEPLHDTGKDVQ